MYTTSLSDARAVKKAKKLKIVARMGRQSPYLVFLLGEQKWTTDPHSGALRTISLGRLHRRYVVLIKLFITSLGLDAVTHDA